MHTKLFNSLFQNYFKHEALVKNSNKTLSVIPTSDKLLLSLVSQSNLKQTLNKANLNREFFIFQRFDLYVKTLKNLFNFSDVKYDNLMKDFDLKTDIFIGVYFIKGEDTLLFLIKSYDGKLSFGMKIYDPCPEDMLTLLGIFPG